MKEYLRKIQVTKSENTYKTYYNALYLWFPTGDVNLNLDYIMNRIQSWDVNTNTKVLRCAVLKSFLKYYSRKHNTNNIDDIYDMLNITPENKVPECVSLTQFRIIINQPMSQRLKLILCLMYENGLRSDEALSLKFDNFHDNHIVLEKTKNHTERVIYLTDNVLAMLTEYINNDTVHSDYIFHTSSGKKVDCRNLRKEIKAVCVSAGYPQLHAHSFRHGSAKFLLDNNVNIAKIQAHLGHASITTTQRYLRVDSKIRQEVTQLFSNIA